MTDNTEQASAGSGAVPQPGATISPTANAAPPAGPVPSPSSPAGASKPVGPPQTQQAQPEAAAAPGPPPPPQAEQSATKQPAAPVSPEPEQPVDDQIPADGQAEPDDGITWTASEFIAHQKSSGWYAALFAGTVVLAAVAFLMTRGLVAVVVVLIAGVIFGMYASHQPRQLEYVVNRQGVGVGPRFYSYEEFSSFSMVPDGAFSSLVFMPLKRFGVPLTIYYPPEDEQRIVSLLGDYLPLENHQGDAVDRLVRKVRF